jgi:large subunit ribosomal protein L35
VQQKDSARLHQVKLKEITLSTSHILEKKSPKRKRNLRKSAIMAKGDAQRVIKLIPYK